MKKIVFATNNQNKVLEIKQLAGNLFDIISSHEAGINIDIPEPYNTLEANASEKSQTIFKLTGKDCFSEDTGLETEALNGEPGVRSARYAGDGKGSEENIRKLLSKLHKIENRKAQFRTVISAIIDGNEYQFMGICEGEISLKPRGETGFGYDPVFIPAGDIRTFAEMSLTEKNTFSHRRKAFDKFVQFLAGYYMR